MAQANTGLMYATGTGTETDKARGYAWYSLAASRGNTVAAINRNNLMMEMSWDELNRAQAISLQLYREVERMAAPKMIAPEALQE
jgi:TPR repeat protein